MILRRMRLHPFGFFADKEVSFQPGLNVVLGANEAGKSTVFNAARSSLLRTKLRKPEFEKYLARFLPSGGGDTLCVEMEFTAADGTYRLGRRWGPRPASELVLPKGGTLSDDDAVAKALESALPAKPGTFWKVLMTGHAELAATAEALSREGGDALVDLADALRRTLQETGGVSVDRFRLRLEEEIKVSFSHWDADRGPEKNRGIENPWEKEVGAILMAFYARETVKEKLRRAREIEDGLDTLNAELRAVSSKTADANTFIDSNKKAAADAAERRTLEARLQAACLEQEKLKKANREWPVAESRRDDLRKKIAESASRRVPLEKEKKAAEKQSADKSFRERMARVARRKTLLLEAEARLAAAPKPDAAALERLRVLWAELQPRNAGEAQGISMSVTALHALELEVSPDSGPAKMRKLSAGETVRFEATGKLRIASPEMAVEAEAGKAGGQAARAQAERAVKELLGKLGASGLAEAEEMHRSAETLHSEARLARENLEEELAGEKLPELEKLLAGLGAPVETRSPAEAEAALARLDVELHAAERDLADTAERIAEWAAAFGNQEKLLDALTDARAKETNLRKAISDSAALPPGFAEAEAFLTAYEKAREALRDGMEKRSALLVRKAELEAAAPDTASEELAGELEEAEARFNAARRRGDALRRIRALTEKLLVSSDVEIFSGMKKNLEGLISLMTGRRYSAVDMSGSLPRGLLAEGGGTLDWERLSAGTKDVLALAIRLAMASHFIGKEGGFLMMDDPLVDLDPGRRAAAAKALDAFARNRQLILFTCHPETADLLGGNKVLL